MDMDEPDKTDDEMSQLDDSDIPPEPKRYRKYPHKNIKTLNLNLKEALAGRTWLLLPSGSRDPYSAATYPLPWMRRDLQRLAIIPIPPFKRDAGCIYIRRAQQAFKAKVVKSQSAALDIGRRMYSAEKMQEKYRRKVKDLKREAEDEVQEVRKTAEKAIATLTDLFALAREGIEGQMRAHLEDKEWRGERIDSAAFRQMFRMVTQSVKGLGLPSQERSRARETIMEEAAAAIKDTQEAVAMAPGGDETEH